MLANAFGDYAFLPASRFRVNIGADLSNRSRDTYYPRTTLQGAGLNGRALRGTLNSTSWLNEYTLNYTTSIGDLHRIQAVAGYTRQQQTQVREQLNNSNFVSDVTGFESIGSGNQAGGPTLASGTIKTALASYLGRINYTLADKYLFTATARRDGSSRFGADHRWGVFPSAAIGWRVSEEPFMRTLHGDRSAEAARVVRHRRQSVHRAVPVAHASELGPVRVRQRDRRGVLSRPRLGNADLRWESTKQVDYGVDLGMYQDRFSFTADYYHKRTDDLLLQIDLPSEAGFSTAFVNAGSIENKGLELGATIQMIRGDQKAGAFSWTTTVNYTRNRNKVLSLGDTNVKRFFATSINSDIKAAGSLVQVGQPIGVFFGYQVDGIFRDTATLNAYKLVTTTSNNPGLGSSRFVDINNDGVIDANDRTIIGDPSPKFSLGWQNSVSYKGFQLSALLDGTYGGKIFNLNLYRLEGASPSGNVLRSRVEDAWSTTNPNGQFAKIGSGIGFLGADFTSELIEDGSYTRLRTVTLAREIPHSGCAA